MDSKEIIKEIVKNKKELKKAGVKRIGLFGSFLKGKEKKDSDIDFIVDFKKIDFDNYYFLLTFLERLFGRGIDLVIGDDLKPEMLYVKGEARYVEV